MIIISNVQKIITIFADMIDIQIYNIHDDVTILNMKKG